MSYLKVKDTYTIGFLPEDNELPLLLSVETFKHACFSNESLRKLQVSTVEYVPFEDRVKEIMAPLVEELRKAHDEELQTQRKAHNEELRAQRKAYDEELRARGEALGEELRAMREAIAEELGFTHNIPAARKAGSRSRQSSPTKKSVFSSEILSL